MKTENKRIFINDLPETTTYDELVSNFKKYGQVSSVEIKERKELGPSNKSLFFAYVNLITDDKGINQCFQEIPNIEWHGQYVQLQIARESFLERLRREREEGQNNIASKVNNVIVKPEEKQNGLDSSKPREVAVNNLVGSHKKVVETHKPFIESESESGSESDNDSKTIKIAKKLFHTKIETVVSEHSEPEEKLDIIIKNNRDKIINKSGLRIPSVGNEPIIKITKTKEKLNDSKSNLKRLQSLRDMKKSYVAQKSFIKNSLTYGINKPNTKIVFDDNGADDATKHKINGLQKNTLFDEDRSDDGSEFELNFEVKEQFQGKSGQKLLELQSKYKNDKRFALDKRFVDVANEDGTEPMETEDVSEETIEAEKRTELKILEELLGKKMRPTRDQTRTDGDKKKTMLRFDPSQPDHSNFEVTVNSEDKMKKNKKDRRKEVQEDLNLEPEVSKEVFYKVTDNLKETFEEKQQFSLLSMFGKVEENRDELQEGIEKEIKQSQLIKSQNPFKYDSSDDENDTEDIPHRDETRNTSQSTSTVQKTARATAAVFWTEPFFFKTDDFRLQEGLDFIEKIKTENKEFGKIRRDLKGIVKAKVRNNERKNKMFKKKLGGSKRRKHIRMKKALKR